MARSRPRSRWAFRLFLAVLAAIALWAAWEAVTWPDVARLAREQPKTTAFIDEYRARQRILGKPPRVAWTWAPYAAISPDIKRAVLVAEDINFFSHRGFELAELQNALEEALRIASCRAAPPRSPSSSPRTCGCRRPGIPGAKPRRPSSRGRWSGRSPSAASSSSI